MASKTVVELFDDLDGGRADETVSFALDGVDYEIDLSSANAAQLRHTLAEYVSHAHRQPGKAAKRTPKPEKPTKPTKPVTGSSASLTAEIRRLASESAKKVSEAAAAAEAEPDTFDVPDVHIPTSQPAQQQQEPVRALVIPFQEAGL